MWSVSIVLFSKKSYYLHNQDFQEWQSVVLKLVILKYFENIELIPTIKI